MSADKRSVATDALATLGTIISKDEKRDAIHLAVEPVIAGQDDLRPGTDVGVVIRAGKTFAVHQIGVKFIGIVDPFLTHTPKKGEMFWLVIYPRQITSLRHVWEHPDIPTTEDIEATAIVEKLSGKSDSQEWILRFSNEVGLDYDELLDAAGEFLDHGQYINKGDLLDGEYVPEEFWDHYEQVVGTIVAEYDRGSFFSCSC